MADSRNELQLVSATKSVRAINVTNQLTRKIGTLLALIKKMDISTFVRMTSVTNRLNSSLRETEITTSGTTKAIKENNDTMTKTFKNTFDFSSIMKEFVSMTSQAKNTVNAMYTAVESTTDYISSYKQYINVFNEISTKWGKDLENHGTENAKQYTGVFLKQMNEGLSKLSGMQFSLSADRESGTFEKSNIKNLGLNIQETTEYATKLASMANALGYTGEVTMAVASAFTKLSGDISSSQNVDYTEAAENLKKCLVGQMDALEEYGIYLNNADLETYAYKLGLQKTVNTMTDAEKTQLRMIAILGESENTWGSLANTINSPVNMFKQWTNSCKEIIMVLGQLFTPILEGLFPVINGLTTAFKNFLTSIAGLFGITVSLGTMNNNSNMLTESLQSSASSYKETAKVAAEYENQLLGMDEITKLQPTNSTTVGSEGGEIGDTIDLSEEIIDAALAYEAVWNNAYENMENRAQQFADSFSTIFNKIEKIVHDFSFGDYFMVGQDVSNLVIGLTELLVNAISSVEWEKIGKCIGDFIGEFIAGIDFIGVLGSFGKLFWEGIVAAIDVWKGIFSEIPIGTLIATALPIMELLSNMQAGFSKVSAVLAKFSTSTLVLRGGLTVLAAGLGIVFATNEDVRKGFQNAIEDITEGLQPVVEFVTDTLLPDLVIGFELLEGMLMPFGEFLYNTFVSIWQDWLNPILSYIGTNLLPVLAWAFENLWNNVLVPLGVFVESVFTPIFKTISSVLETLWKYVVIPLGSAIGEFLGTAFEGIVSFINDPVIPIFNEIIYILQRVWDGIIIPMASFISDVFGPVFLELFKAIESYINSVKNIFTGYVDFIVGVFTKDWKKAWEGVVEIVTGTWDKVGSKLKAVLNPIIALFEGLVNKVIEGWNFLIKGLNGFSIDIPSWVPIIGGKKFGIKLETVSKIEIPRLASGGFPEDGWFRASHGEIMGRFDNGKSVVANNMQITQGIANAVYPAVYDAMTAALAHGNNVGGDIVVQIGEKEVFRAVRREANNYTRQTGKAAFIY